MATAFQANAFQNNAFQIVIGPFVFELPHCLHFLVTLGRFRTH